MLVDWLTGLFVPNPVLSITNKNVRSTVNRPFIGGLKIYCLNIHLDEVRITAEEYSPHIICLNETKLNSDIENEELIIKTCP